MTSAILVTEDDPTQLKILTSMLTKKLGYDVVTATNGKEAIETLEKSNVTGINAVLLDINMPIMDGMEALKHIRKLRPFIPVLMLTAVDDTAIAVKAIKEGASDFILKPPNIAQLDVALKNAIRMSALARELSRVKRDNAGALGFSDLIGHEGGLANVIALGTKAAASDVPVLITGETSTGKELLARAIHGEGSRVGGPFVSINCGTIPKETVESVLFGHEKGAFAGATMRSIGKLREAERGTVFLDDIHMLPPDAQIRLLRVLQDKEVDPVGALKPAKVNIRVISATDRHLKAEVDAGRFREDLYFRLNVLMIAMPPLRQRKQDIVPLVEYFVQRISSTENLPMRPLSADAKYYLADYTWPGNIREMEGLIYRALMLCEDDMIDRPLLAQIRDSDTTGHELTEQKGAHIALRKPNGTFKTMEEIETEAMKAALEHYENNITRAAESLGIAKSTFYRKMKDAGIDASGDAKPQ